MANFFWRGTVNGNFGTKENWVDDADATPGAGPINSSVCIFDQGNVDVDAGLTSGITGVTITGTTGYTGRIGPTAPLSIALTSLRWLNSSSLNLTGNITSGFIRCRTGAVFNYAGGTATLLYIEATDYALVGDVTTLRTYQSQGSDLQTSTDFTLLEMYGGTHTARRDGLFIVNGGATLKAKDGCILNTGTTVHRRSRLDYLSSEEISGTVTVWPDAIFDAGGSNTFTWSGELEQWAGAIVNLSTAGGTVVPSTVTQFGFGDDVGGFTPVP